MPCIPELLDLHWVSYTIKQYINYISFDIIVINSFSNRKFTLWGMVFRQWPDLPAILQSSFAENTWVMATRSDSTRRPLTIFSSSSPYYSAPSEIPSSKQVRVRSRTTVSPVVNANEVAFVVLLSLTEWPIWAAAFGLPTALIFFPSWFCEGADCNWPSFPINNKTGRNQRLIFVLDPPKFFECNRYRNYHWISPFPICQTRKSCNTNVQTKTFYFYLFSQNAEKISFTKFSHRILHQAEVFSIVKTSQNIIPGSPVVPEAPQLTNGSFYLDSETNNGISVTMQLIC